MNALARRFTLERTLFLVLLAALAWLIIPPIIVLVETSLRPLGGGPLGFDNYRVVLENIASANDAILLNSFVFAIGGAAFAVVLGTTLAWLAERTDAPFRSLAYLAAFISFAVPGIIKVIAWILLLGPNGGFLTSWIRDLLGLESSPFSIFSMGGMIFLEGLSWAPVVFLLMSSPFRAMDPSLEESAAMSGAGPRRTFWQITFRLALPSVAAVLLLTLVRSLQSFDIAALIGIPANIDVFTTKIYLAFRAGFLPRYGEAAAYSVALVAIVALALMPYYRLNQRGQQFATITGKGFRPHRIELGPWRPLAGLLMLTMPMLLVLPFLVMVWASLLPYVQAPSFEALAVISLDNYGSAFGNSSVVGSIMNTFVVSTVSATAVVLITLLASWVVQRSRIGPRWLLDLLATVPLVFPGIVLGLGVLRTYLTVPFPVYGTVWIIAIAFIAKFLPYGMRYNQAGLVSIHRELEESAQMSGASFAMVARRILMPLLLPALLAAWLYVFLVTSHELSEALLLTTPGNEILSITIWDLWQNGQLGDLTAFSVVITSVLVCAAFLLVRLSRSARVF